MADAGVPVVTGGSALTDDDARDATMTFSIDLWNLTFPAPGDYSFRLLVNGSEQKRLPLVVTQLEDGSGGTPPAERRVDA